MSLRSVIKSILPTVVRRFLRAAHRDLVFRRAMRRFLKSPEACVHPGSPVLADLIYGWGNDGWNAMDDYLVGCIHDASAVTGPILECGSGLSTILVGAIAKMRGQPHWALEHMPEWATKVRRQLRRYELDSVLCVEPLRDYGAFSWYDPPLESMPDSFSLVVCDGPPASTRGGRWGLAPIMRKRLRSGCVVLLDDADREHELTVAKRWEAEIGASVSVLGTAKPYVRMTLNGKQPADPAAMPARRTMPGRGTDDRSRPARGRPS